MGWVGSKHIYAHMHSQAIKNQAKVHLYFLSNHKINKGCSYDFFLACNRDFNFVLYNSLKHPKDISYRKMLII